jgi:radical SAM superfamily enzyme YgiQ (UPF0313 family)
MKKKLLLINPRNHKIGGFADAGSKFPPLGLGMVAAVTPDSWEVEILDENYESFTLKKADLVGLTAFTTTAPRAYEIASEYRKRGITTIMGGTHVSAVPDEALMYVDAVVVGEAEGVWPNVVDDYEQNRLEKVYQGEKIDPEKLPMARHDLFYPRYNLSSVQTSRGCPMDCEFCSVTSFNGHRYRQRPIEDVLDELAQTPHRRLFFVDDNLIGTSRESKERAIALFKGMIERKLNKLWGCQSSINFADSEEVLRYAAASGCRWVLIGAEAETKDALVNVNKKLNLSVGIENYDGIFRKINKYGISVLGAFIFGLDSDTLADIRYRTDYVISSSANTIQACCLTPLPGTRLMKKLSEEGRLLYDNYPEDWQYHDFLRLVFKPKLMGVEEFKREFSNSIRKIYSKNTIIRKSLRAFFRSRSPFLLYFSYWKNSLYRKLYQVSKWHG